jgi:hypothetical protein
MNILLDTNILIHVARDQSGKLLEKLIYPSENQLFLSVATLGELKSIAIQNTWGNRLNAPKTTCLTILNRAKMPYPFVLKSVGLSFSERKKSNGLKHNRIGRPSHGIFALFKE